MNVIGRAVCFMSKENALLSLSITTSLQCRNKVNIKHPRPVHKERRLLDAVTQPVYANQLNNQGRVCSIFGSEELDLFAQKPSVSQRDMYEAFVIREAQKIFESNSMIIAFQPEALDARKRTQICNKLYSAGFSAVFYPLDLLRRAVFLSKWQNMTLLLQSQTIVVVGKCSHLFDLLNITKKIPELILLGGFVDDVLLTREGLVRCARLPSINEMHSELVNLLGLSVSMSHHIMQLKQSSLLQSLEYYHKHNAD